ncbi:glycosyltransferase [Candidatus Gottesmanbacteria bacterium]|nr:glycosyltransferase [Candidatus Gottesmanbacteria bacterium]
MNEQTNTTKLRRVAIVHDVLLYHGGAERVLWELLRMFPAADVYTSFLVPSIRDEVGRLTRGRVLVSRLDHFPLARRFADWFKVPLFFYWEHLDLSGYDLVISSSHSFSSKAVVVGSGALHVSYIHTSPRYLYAEYSETRPLRIPFVRFLLAPFLSWARALDYRAAQRSHILVANSKTVQKRIQTYYKRESLVIYPPVRFPKTMRKTPMGKYFLCVSRLVKQKGIELAIRACNKLCLPLVVVGTGKEEGRLRSLAGPTILFRGFISDDELDQVYQRAKALIFCARDEDFGMVPVEAMAHGVPVIAYNSGGVRETVVDGKTGVLFHNYSTESLTRAIKQFENLNFSQKFLHYHAKHFSEERFTREFKGLIDKYFQDGPKQ